MLIYWKGIGSAELELIIDFMYNGETFTTKEQLKLFLDTGKDLKIDGLQSEFEIVSENKQDTLKKEATKCEIESDYTNNVVAHEGILENVEELADTFQIGDCTLDTMEGGNITLNRSEELHLQIKQMVEKSDGRWKCKMCGKTATKKDHIQRHAETHIEGVSHACHICNKALSRSSLRYHMKRCQIK